MRLKALRRLSGVLFVGILSTSVVEASPIVIGSFDSSRSPRPVLGSDYINLRAGVTNPANFGPGGIVNDPVSFAAATGLVDAPYLALVNVFFMSEANALAAGEITALSNFVLGGNKLILVSDSGASAGMNQMMGALDGGSLGGSSGANGTNLGAFVAAGKSTVGPFGNLVGDTFSVSLHSILNGGANTTTIGRSSGAAGTAILAEIAPGALGAGSGAVLMAGDVLFMDFFWPPGSLFSDPQNAEMFNNFLATPAQQVVPEPSTVALLGLGLLGCVGAARRRRAPKKVS